ncbi:MAG: hypothetical protein O2856_00150 [Planctomycetota bacterium]|nr:hypothetical protein [Planctomycetota bacterium]
MKMHGILISITVITCVAGIVFAQEPETKKSPTAAPQQAATIRERTDPMRDFMRKKLDASSKILEGLCQEDMVMVQEAANELREMSSIAKWKVLTDEKYREYSREFRDNAALVAEAAEKGDIDKATLQWFSVTMSCLKCHEHVRSANKSKK